MMIKLNLNLGYVQIEYIYEDHEIDKLWDNMLDFAEEEQRKMVIFNAPGVPTDLFYSTKRFELERKFKK